MPEASVWSMFQTLQQAAHHVSTAFGVLARTYGRNRQIPLQGAGQGNGAGMAIWAAISSVLIMDMATQGHGFNILSAIRVCWYPSSATLLLMTPISFMLPPQPLSKARK
jgi:hypothetical protein